MIQSKVEYDTNKVQFIFIILYYDYSMCYQNKNRAMVPPACCKYDSRLSAKYSI